MDKKELDRFLWHDPLSTSNSFINLVQVGWNKCLPRSSYSHFRDMYIVHIIKSGSGVVETDGHRYNLGKNEVFLVRPNQLTVQTANPDDPWELYYFSFKGPFSEELLSKTCFKNGGFYSIISDTSIFDFIVETSISLTDEPEQEIKMLEYLFKMLSYFEEKNNSSSPNKNNTDFVYQKYVSTIQEYIQLNFSKTVKISELSERLGLSRSHLHRIFKTCTGKSIQDYLVSVRINTARSLLADTDLSCSSIAMSVGYAHYTTFFKMFKLNTGLTPQEYRDIAKAKTAPDD